MNAQSQAVSRIEKECGCVTLPGIGLVSSRDGNQSGEDQTMRIDEQRLKLTQVLYALLIDYWHNVDLNWGRNAPDYYTEDARFSVSPKYRRISGSENGAWRAVSRRPAWIGAVAA